MTAQLKGLTPGDFACVRRRLAFAPLSSEANRASALLALLREELRLKTKGTQPIGFYCSDKEIADLQTVLDLL